METIGIGSRRELFVDEHLIEALKGGAQRRLHTPTPCEMVLRPEGEWESRIGYITVFRDEGRYRMYYKSGQMRDMPEEKDEGFGVDDCVVAYAESSDGIRWEKPSLGLFEFAGSTNNNIVWKGQGSHGFAPFRDTRPGCPPQERYKAFGRSRVDTPDGPPDERHWRSLFALASPDGLHWTVKKGPKKFGAIMDRDDGYFDSQNVGFWDDRAGCYRAYVRKKSPALKRGELAGRDDGDGGIDRIPLVRDIATATSDDFVHWTKPEFLAYPGAPVEELYTNMITPYYRAPHIMLGFPARYVENRGFLTARHEELAETRPGRYFQSYTDGLFMSSRDGRVFHRWGEAFLRPGMPEESRWAYGECYQNWGIVETAREDVPGAPNELSFYVSEGNRIAVHNRGAADAGVRRHTLRKDGFVSVNAPLAGGELVTKPFVFSGGKLTLNVATSAAGTVRVEIQDGGGAPLAGFSLGDCAPLYGNSLEKHVVWNSGARPTDIAGKPVRLRFEMSDAALYSFRFAPEEEPLA